MLKFNDHSQSLLVQYEYIIVYRMINTKVVRTSSHDNYFVTGKGTILEADAVNKSESSSIFKNSIHIVSLIL